MSKGRDKSAVRIFSVRQWRNMSNGKKKLCNVVGLYMALCNDFVTRLHRRSSQSRSVSWQKVMHDTWKVQILHRRTVGSNEPRLNKWWVISTCVTLKDGGKRAGGQYPYTCRVPTTWQVFISDTHWRELFWKYGLNSQLRWSSQRRMTNWTV